MVRPELRIPHLQTADPSDSWYSKVLDTNKMTLVKITEQKNKPPELPFKKIAYGIFVTGFSDDTQKDIFLCPESCESIVSKGLDSTHLTYKPSYSSNKEVINCFWCDNNIPTKQARITLDSYSHFEKNSVLDSLTPHLHYSCFEEFRTDILEILKSPEGVTQIM